VIASKRRVWLRSVIGAAAAACLLGTAGAQDTLKIGLLANLEGPFAVPGQDGYRGADMALKEMNGMAGGKKIEFVKVSSDATPDKAVAMTRKAVEQDKVQVMIGPLSGDEGIAVKNYAKTKPDITFINGSSGAQATTLADPAPNFYRFNTEGAQWMVGLGEHALSKGYKKVFLVSEDYGFPYSQVQGFMASYCAKGGKVVDKAWVPLGTKDYAAVVAKIPKDIDAVLVVLGGSDAVNFLNQYEQAGGNKPMIGGSITVDQTVLNYKGKRRESLLGTMSAGPMADSIDTPEWKKFVADYKAQFKDGFPSPSLFAYLYYINTRATLEALDAVKGDLSNGQKAYRAALQKTSFKGPAGEVKIDSNRNGVGTTYITEVTKAPDGSFYNKVVKTVPNISQTLGLPEAEFKKMGLGSRDVPDCRK
jgi:branched-chain amino acid transport system substrate-binding protein